MTRTGVETLRVPYASPGGGRSLELVVRRPAAATGPSPAVLDVHGGAWTHFDHHVDFYWCEALARRGFLVASVEFRLAPAHPWPTFFEDVRAAARWLRRHGAALGADTRSIGAIGGSTGGHLAILLGLDPLLGGAQPTAALDVPDDAPAHADWVVALYPIVDVPGRYDLVRTGSRARDAPPRIGRGPGELLHALARLRERHPLASDAVGSAAQHALWLAGLLPPARAKLYAGLATAHEGAFGSRAEMEAASPLHLVQRGTCRRRPPMLVLQGRDDPNLTAESTVAFTDAYRAAGGTIELELLARHGHAFGNVPSPQADRAIERAAAFGRAPLAAGRMRCDPRD